MKIHQKKMALIDIRHFSPGTILGLWQISESTAEFYLKYPYLSIYREEVDLKFRSDNRKKEFLAIRALLHEIYPDDTPFVSHELSGKPILSNGYNVSISHTNGYAVLIVSEKDAVAVDIEYRSDRVSKVANKFIREDEEAPDVLSQLINWSAKETVYKYFSSDNLEYFQMKMHHIQPANEGCVTIENMKRSTSVSVHYEITEAYVLTYMP